MFKAERYLTRSEITTNDQGAVTHAVSLVPRLAVQTQGTCGGVKAPSKYAAIAGARRLRAFGSRTRCAPISAKASLVDSIARKDGSRRVDTVVA